MKFWFLMVLAVVVMFGAMALAFTPPPTLWKWGVMVLAAFVVFFCGRKALQQP